MAELKKGKVLFPKEENVWGYIKGKAQWAKVLEPGEYEAFEIDLYPSDEDMAHYKEVAQGVAQVAFDGAEEVGKKATIQDEFHKEKEGKEFLKFKLEATGFEGVANKIDIYDANGTKQPDWDELIGNGSEVKIKYRLKPYFMTSSKVAGASSRFYAVQVIDLVPYVSGGDSGFGDESGQSGDGAEPHDGEDF